MIINWLKIKNMNKNVVNIFLKIHEYNFFYIMKIHKNSLKFMKIHQISTKPISIFTIILTFLHTKNDYK